MPQLASQVTITPDGGNASDADGVISIVFPPGAVEQDTVVTVSPVSGGFGIGRTHFSVTASAGGVPIVALLKEVTICVKYTDADVDYVGGDPNLLQLSYYDEELGEWVTLETTVDTEQGVACAGTYHLSEWALMKGGASSLPPWWIWLIVASLFGGLSLVYYLVCSHIHSVKKRTIEEEIV
jgi:hypothetical protein